MNYSPLLENKPATSVIANDAQQFPHYPLFLSHTESWAKFS